jgi:TadE-like protein
VHVCTPEFVIAGTDFPDGDEKTMSIRETNNRRTSAVKASPLRPGTTSVEMALIMPVFFVVLFAIVEFGHAMMVRSLVMSTTKDAARLGAVGEVTTAEVRDYINGRLAKAMDPEEVTILIKNAGFMDDADPDFPENLATLPDIELSETDSRHPFIIRITVPYESTALLPPAWTTGMVISSDSVVRHE